MTDSEAARAAIGALPPTPEQPVEAPEVANEPLSATAPTQFSAPDLGAEVGAIDPLAMVGTIKTLVNLSTKVLGLVARFPGPQQATAQELLKILDDVNAVLSRIP